MNKLLLPVLGASLIVSQPAWAEDVDQVAATASSADRTAATALEDVVVTAHRSAQQIDRVGASVTVLTRAALEKTQAMALPEALARTPGVSFTRNGPIGTPSSVNIRGAEGYHTVVLIDGVKMNDPSTTQGGVNFSNLLVGDVGRIEVLRGTQSTLWGSQAIGGVVNIITAEPTQSLQGNLSAEAGSYGTRSFRGAIGGVQDRLSWRLAANRYDTDGFSAYATGTEDDGYSNTSLSGRLNYQLAPSVSVDLRAVYMDGTNDFDAYNGDSREYGNTEELATYTGVNFGLFEGRMNNRVGLSYTSTDRNNTNPDRLVQPTSLEAKGENKRFEYQGVFAFTDDLSATFGVETERAEMRIRSPWDTAVKPDFGTGRSDQDSAYLQFQWVALPSLNLTAGLRYDDHAQYGDHSLGQFAAAWSLNDGRTVLRANWGQGFRAPSLYELYSEYGNLSLQPEEFDAWEVGIQQNLPMNGAISLTYFNREADNEIRYYSCTGTPDPLCEVNGVSRWGYYANVQKTQAQGLEIAGKIDITSSLNLSGNYTWTEALNGSGTHKNKHLIRRPEHMANLSADYAFASGFKLGVAARYAGEVFTNEANTSTLASYTLVDVRFAYPVNDALELYGRVENLTDEQYQIVPSYGTADRSVYAGIRVSF